MIDYRAGSWGFHVACGVTGSLGPRALAVAVPNALLTLGVCYCLQQDLPDKEEARKAELIIEAATAVMIFILYNRSRTSYDRWWEGGTLLQKTRGEWFNAYSSIMAFTSAKPELQEKVMAYSHLVARLMSLLMCCGLQQVSPNVERAFEILDPAGIDVDCLDFLNQAPDKVEILLQWMQRSMVDQMQTGVLPIAPPILSRAFQEFSRGIVNLQNARKIADFPYPYPLAQMSMILQLLHWAAMPFYAAFAFSVHTAVLFSFVSIFVLWGIHFNALDLEFPFGDRVNDLPMLDFQRDWNESVASLLMDRARNTPDFAYDSDQHGCLNSLMSDGTENPNAHETSASIRASRGFSKLRRSTISLPKDSTRSSRTSQMSMSNERSSTMSLPSVRISSNNMTGALPSVPERFVDIGLRGACPEADVASEREAPTRFGQQSEVSGIQVNQIGAGEARPSRNGYVEREKALGRSAGGGPSEYAMASVTTFPKADVLEPSFISAPARTSLMGQERI